jgi:4'-phosphopantetheinyl transferase
VVEPSAAELAFSMSHTAGLVIAVVARGLEIGVDVERVRDRPRPFPPAFFTPDERLRLHALSERERDREILRVWTAKEAYAKARGLGLRLPFAKLELDDAGTLSIDPALDPAPHRWRTHALALGEQHVGTLVVGRITDRAASRAETDRSRRTAG